MYDFDTSWLKATDREIIHEVQEDCAEIAERMKAGGDWTTADGERIAGLFNRSTNPGRLFRWMDEKTGHSSVGYRTDDGREYFHVLRQMRNQPGSGLLETMRYD